MSKTRERYAVETKKSRKWLEDARVQMNEGKTIIELPISIAEAIGNTQEMVADVAERTGLILMKAIMNGERTNLAGLPYHPIKDSPYGTWGNQPGYVIWAGKKMPLRHPRVRTKVTGETASKEVPLKSYLAFQDESGLDKRIGERVMLKLSSRNYERAIDDFCEGYGLKKSSISRHFIKVSKKKLDELMERPLGKMDLVVIGIDGVAIAGEVLVIAVGIDLQGKKQMLGLWQGGTENSDVCTMMLTDMIRRGLKTDRRYLFLLDGAKALSKGVRDVFGADSLIQRCQIHKRRNVKSHLPEEYHEVVDSRIRAAYNMSQYKDAKKILLETVEYLEQINPTAARSLEEGLEETLTVHRLGLPDILRRTVSNTNFVESPLSVTRDVTRNVKRWRHGNQRLRWAASALLEAERRMHHIRGHRVISVLVNALKNIQNIDKQAMGA